MVFFEFVFSITTVRIPFEPNSDTAAIFFERRDVLTPDASMKTLRCPLHTKPFTSRLQASIKIYGNCACRSTLSVSSLG